MVLKSPISFEKYKNCSCKSPRKLYVCILYGMVLIWQQFVRLPIILNHMCIRTKNCTCICGGKVFLDIKRTKNISTEFMVALSSIIMAFVRGIWRRYEITYYVHTLALLPGTGSDGSSLRSFRKRNTLLDKTPTFYGRVTIYFGKTKNKNFVVRSRNL